MGLALLLVGSLLSKQRQTEMTVQLVAPVDLVWQRVTMFQKQEHWRSDLKRIVVVSVDGEASKWIEVPKVGPSVTFCERTRVENAIYTIDIIPTRGFSGYSTITFQADQNNLTTITFVEVSEISNPYMRVLSRLLYNPRKRMQVYIDDLREAL